MDRYVLLDSGPLGLALCRRGTKDVDALRDRLAELERAGVSILIPAVIDYEVRRELVRVRATAKLKNLADMQQRFPILPVSGVAWFRAAEFWALSRRMGLPTGPDAALDADALSWPGARPPWDGRAMRWSSRRATSATCRGSRASTRGSGSPSGLEGLGAVRGFAPRTASSTGHSHGPRSGPSGWSGRRTARRAGPRNPGRRRLPTR